MENEKIFPEQKAPEKNTDNAFVQVGKDGSPISPSENNEKNTDNITKEYTTTLGER